MTGNYKSFRYSKMYYVILRNITIFYNYLYIRYYIKPFKAYATKPQQKYHKMCAHTFEVYASPVKIKL